MFRWNVQRVVPCEREGACNQIDELKGLCTELLAADEGGTGFLLLRDAILPPACVPAKLDLLLCPAQRDGYESRLFFAEKPSCTKALNWSGPVRILDRNWWVYSWKIPNGCRLRLAQMVSTHLAAMR